MDRTDHRDVQDHAPQRAHVAGLRAPPSVSVVIPTYRRPLMLSRCLAAILWQSLPPSAYEIVICDDACDAATHDIVAWAAERCRAAGYRITYLRVTDSEGPAGARNRGWRAARADVVAFTDDDTIPDRHWLERGLAAMRGGASAVSGRIVVPLPARPTDHELRAFERACAEFATANCFVYRPMLERIDGFDARYTSPWREDADLQFSILREGGTIVRANDAIVLHPVRPAPFGVSVAQQRRSQFDALLYKKHPKLYRARVAASPPWSDYAIVACAGGGIAGAVAALPVLALGGGAGWLALTSVLAWKRMRSTSRTPAHVVEMALTSVLIPPLSVFWRLYGAVKFRAAFL